MIDLQQKMFPVDQLCNMYLLWGGGECYMFEEFVYHMFAKIIVPTSLVDVVTLAISFR